MVPEYPLETLEFTDPMGADTTSPPPTMETPLPIILCCRNVFFLFGLLIFVPWTVDTGQWTLDSGHWTVDTGQWTVDTGHYTNKKKTEIKQI